MAVHIKKNPETKDGRQTLYLLTYHNYQPIREALKTFVYVFPKTKQERDHNKERMAFAEQVRAARELEFDQGGVKTSQRVMGEGSFLQYFERIMREKYDVNGTYTTWRSTLLHMRTFLRGRDLKIKDCNDEFLKEFKQYLLKCNGIRSTIKLGNSSANIYLTKVKAALNQAVNERVIVDNPGKRLKNVKMDGKIIEYLSIDELSKLAKAPCINPLLKSAFMFSCLTGLRWSDVSKLTWRKVVYSESKQTWELHYKQQKTKTIAYHPISDQAMAYAGKKGESDELVFKGLKYSTYHCKVLREWVRGEGIDKHITFHCARHTYAVMMHSMTGNIALVRDMLGHSDIKTTMKYVVVTNNAKINAVKLFPTI
jgi:integrase/recombinase XerD